METEATTSASTAAIVPGTRVVPELAGLTGRVRVQAGDKTVGVLHVDGGRVRLEPDGGAAQAALICASEDDFRRIMRGELNVVVAALQARLAVEGDLVLAIKVVLSLAAAARRSAAEVAPVAPGTPAKEE